MKDISLIKVDELRLVAEGKIKQAIEEFYKETGLIPYVEVLIESIPVSCGVLVDAKVKLKVVLND